MTKTQVINLIEIYKLMEMGKIAKSIDFNSLSNVICQIFVLLLILDRIVSDVDCIVNNGNILTDRRWRCHYQSQERICWRE